MPDPELASPAARALFGALLAHLFASGFSNTLVYRLFRQGFPMTLPGRIDGSPTGPRDTRAEAFNVIDVRPLHHPDELPRVRRETLDIPPLALGIDRIKGEARLARTGEAGDHDELVTGNLNVDVLEIVYPRAFDDELFFRQGL